MRRLPLPVAALVSVSLLLAGCSSDEEPSKEAATPGQAIASGTTLDATWPLTGLAATGSESAAQRHPVLVTKMDNTSSSAPQIGLGEADLVVEELVEGGMTRLAAFYYSQIPEKVGPVRSMRASDIGIVSPVDASVVTSGAAARTIARINGADIPFFQEGAKGIYRDTSRSAPYNVFADLTGVATAAKQPEARPDDYLPWGEEPDLPKGKKATTLAAGFGSHTTNWTFGNGRYVNENTYAAEGDEFPADSVLVLRVQIGDAGYRDPAGNFVPETKFTGTGEAMLFHGGRMIKGTWDKKALGSALSLSTKAGKLQVPAGHVWIELVPAADGSVTFRK